MAVTPYGNDPAKVERYRAFWSRGEASRPLVGFTLVGWFPFGEFEVCRGWKDVDYLTPEMIDPADFIDDHIRMAREGEIIDDDLIRGACPTQAAVPWIPGMVGSRIRVLPDNTMGEEEHRSWDDVLSVRLGSGNPWLCKYLEFADALVEASNGEFPVSHGTEIGPTDLHALMRGHSECILDYSDEPEKSAELLWNMAGIFRDITQEIWKRLPLFGGGYFDAQYSIWAPGPIARLQEDATAVYSPAIYREFVQPVDRWLAKQFECAFMHLHSTSMFLLDDFLAVDEIKCFEINNDAIGPPVAEMVPYFRRVQEAGKPLLVRGSFTPDELRLLMDSLEARGLFLNIMVRDLPEIETLRPLVGM